MSHIMTQKHSDVKSEAKKDKVLCKSLELELISLYFTLKKSDIVLSGSSPGFLKVFQCFYFDKI